MTCKIYAKLLVASAAVHSNGVIMLLLIHCLLLLPVVMDILCLVLVLQCSTCTYCHFLYCNHLTEEERACFFT